MKLWSKLTWVPHSIDSSNSPWLWFTSNVSRNFHTQIFRFECDSKFNMIVFVISHNYNISSFRLKHWLSYLPLLQSIEVQFYRIYSAMDYHATSSKHWLKEICMYIVRSKYSCIHTNNKVNLYKLKLNLLSTTLI